MGRLSCKMETEEQPAKKAKNKEDAEMKFDWKLQPILAKEFTQQSLLQKSFIGVLKEKKSISKAIGSLASSLPCPQYLKRCSGLRIYLCPTEKTNGDPEELKTYLADKGFDLSLLEEEFEVAEVALTAPRTRVQMAYASKLWPVNFHPDLGLEALISGLLFNDSQLSSLEACTKLLTSAASVSVGFPECNGSALIIDPWMQKILVVTASRMNEHPMWHASMLAVDLVATLQGGGSWKLVPEQDDQELPSKRKLTEGAPLTYPTSLELPKLDALTFSVAEKSKTKECGPYLCTGYWAVLLQEPCPLCAMALLHSRVSRIFYGAANPRAGILGSRATLHSVPGLNHRYQVWSGLLKKQCEDALETCLRINNQ